MNLRRGLVLFFLSLPFCPQLARARPILAEEVATLGKHYFEADFSPSLRIDEFNTGNVTYGTVALPVRLTLGLHSTFDIGIDLESFTHRLETDESKLTGSQTGMFSPFIKYTPWELLGFNLVWDVHSSEKDQELPIGRGDNFGGLVLFKLPTEWPIQFNAGYLHRSKYKSNFGVEGFQKVNIEPGNIWQANAAIEIPIGFHIYLVHEWAYYQVESKKIAGQTITGSSGDALDVVGGMGWSFAGWNIGAGASFGLLDEEFTSFDIERGAGDVTYHMMLSYRISPAKLQR